LGIKITKTIETANTNNQKLGDTNAHIVKSNQINLHRLKLTLDIIGEIGLDRYQKVTPLSIKINIKAKYKLNIYDKHDKRKLFIVICVRFLSLINCKELSRII